jgi:tRNA dimethylallyltransferase
MAKGRGSRRRPRSTPYATRYTPKPRVVAVVGPTASGKTDIAIHLARRFHGEIILADSRQLFRGMDIGTNKPEGEWRRANGRRTYFVENIPYYGIDLVKPDEPFTVAQWKTFASEMIDDITNRGHLPILEGGTGLYVNALLDSFTIPAVPPDPLLRRELMEHIGREGIETLVREIAATDPDALTFLDTKNPRRVIRALEVIRATGMPFSAMRKRGRKRYNDLRIGIARPLAELDRRIEERAKRQFALGLEREVRKLVKRYGWDIPAMSGIGYAEWRDFFEGRISRNEVLKRNIQRNRQLARAQLKWFRRDPLIRWVRSAKEAEHLVANFLAPSS